MTDEQDLLLDDSPASEEVKEKMVPQSEVDKIAGISRQQGRREQAIAELQAKQQQNPGAPPVTPKVDEASITRIVEAAYKKAQDETAAEAMRQQKFRSWLGKMEEGTTKYPDFVDKVKALDLEANASLIGLTEQVGHSADVMYELANNPDKAFLIDTLAKEPSGKGYAKALAMTQRIAESIGKNKEAKETMKTKEPLAQIKHSTAGADNGEPTVADLRKDPKYMR